MSLSMSAMVSRRLRRRRPRAAGGVSPQQVRDAHDRLAAELDALLADGVLLDPGALSRLRSVIDEALPAAEAYERQLVEDPAA